MACLALLIEPRLGTSHIWHHCLLGITMLGPLVEGPYLKGHHEKIQAEINNGGSF